MIKQIFLTLLLGCSIHLNAQKIIVDYPLADNVEKDEMDFHKMLSEQFKNKNRVVVYEASMSEAPKFSMKASPLVSSSIEVSVPHLVDSTQTIEIKRTYGAGISAFVSLVNIETSEIVIARWLNNSFNLEKPLLYKYSDFKLTKESLSKMKYKERRNKINEIKKKARKETEKEVQKVIKNNVKGLIPDVAALIRSAFPYQLKVTSDPSSGKGKTYILEGGEKFDLEKRSRVVFYTKEEIVIGDRKSYRLTPLCRGKVKSVNGEQTTVKVSFGKKRLKKAFEKGASIYANEGTTPLALEKELKSALLKIGVADVFIPTAAKPYEQQLVQTLEATISIREDMTLLSRKSLGVVQDARLSQKGENMMDKTAIDQYKMTGADLLVSAEVSEVIAAEDGYLKGFFTINLYDVETGNLLATKKENILRQTVRGVSKVQQIEKVYRTIILNAKPMLDEFFPITTQIIAVEKGKKGKAKTVIVSGNLEKDAYGKANVFIEKKYEVDGEILTRFLEVGEVLIYKNEGDGLFIAKVKEGGKEIFSHLEKNDKLICRKKSSGLSRLLEKNIKLANRLGMGIIND